MKKYLTCQEVADLFDVSLRTVLEWINKKKINAIKTGKFYRIRPIDIEIFEESRSTIKS